MITCTLSINGGPQLNVEDLGVELHTRSESNQAEGQIQLTVLRKPDEPFLFSLNDKVTLYLNGQRWYTGLADQGSVLASSTDH
ncbi:MAG: hypothetical protein JWO08_612, partial [Verrucomicrobiaceae bacterium]|nr:hypothetical protein [Verrucomicrobiaceae bacterium]